MNVQGRAFRTVWAEPSGPNALPVRMIDQQILPHRFAIATMPTHRETARAIRDMTIRGAPAIGAAGAYGLAQAAAEAPPGESRKSYLDAAHTLLRETRPTAYDLFYALDAVMAAIGRVGAQDQAAAALAEAERLADESVERCRRIGEHGAKLIETGMRILTHCNAGWLACVDWGTALAPIYTAHRRGRAVRVLASETRPRLQGANLTAWELAEEGIGCDIIADNAAGLLMQRGEVDLVITGADRIAANGDAANKIGTYTRAVLAREHGIPFYVAAPLSTFDPGCPSGAGIPIEERNQDEVLFAHGMNDRGETTRVRLAPEGARALNPAFDVTPAAFITGLITEFGVIKADAAAISEMARSR